MKRLLFILAAPLLLCLQTVPAQAFEHKIQLGVGQYTIDYVEPLFNASLKPVGVYAGWVGSLNEYISFDARLGATGSKTDVSGLKLSAATFSAFVRPTLPLGDMFEAYGLVGVSSVAVDRSGPGLVQQTVAKAGLSYGVGFDATIADHFSIGAEWVKYIQNENYAAAGAAPINVSVSGISTVVAYHF